MGLNNVTPDCELNATCNNPANPSRRDLFKAAAGTSLLMLLPAAQISAGAADQWTAVGKSADFVANQPKRIALDGSPVIYITRLPDKLVAVTAKCTHRGCEVGWTTPDTQFVCPCHGAAFALDGENLHGTRKHPDEKLNALTAVPIREKDGSVEVNLTALPVPTAPAG